MPRKTDDQRADRGRRAGASMRPRPDATENVPRARGTTTTTSFNEAAARCHGKRAHIVAVLSTPRTGFNEAAARCHGKPRRGPFPAVRPPIASMRPRPDATENGDHAEGVPRHRLASMRPRPDATENIFRIADGTTLARLQ